MRRKVRLFLWRYRFVLAAALVSTAVIVVIGQFRPAPPGVPVLVALEELPAGEPVAPSQVGIRMFPAAPEAVVNEPVGQTPIVSIPAGVPVVEPMLLGPGLVDHAPPGTVMAPVHVADPTMMGMLQVGDVVDVYQRANDFEGSGEAHLIATGVRVLAVGLGSDDSSNILGLNGAEHTTFVGAIPVNATTLFTGAAGLAPFHVVITTEST